MWRVVMSEFEDYFSEYENKHNCSPEKRECFEAGQQSQQSKIDQLNKKNSEEKRILHNVIEMNQSKIDELQGRIDEAMDYIAESGGVNLTSEMALNHILKGNKDEN
jgi:hypothetical protein